ncbi:hypothetical protein S40285_09924 [Stachybotrys chlorohalonatus IBT 40285]|uniref:Uncharacterized protein n=1 Tax=Stachybotrys chlorohalonatus (strain IBT 40285) TaxID=1283841 RepID=A0A084R2F1_STAC4|nr:hypothetical protein S40285_09924 [Stachybotrys chlorohalonata IBT 40285]
MKDLPHKEACPKFPALAGQVEGLNGTFSEAQGSVLIFTAASILELFWEYLTMEEFLTWMNWERRNRDTPGMQPTSLPNADGLFPHSSTTRNCGAQCCTASSWKREQGLAGTLPGVAEQCLQSTACSIVPVPVAAGHRRVPKIGLLVHGPSEEQPVTLQARLHCNPLRTTA